MPAARNSHTISVFATGTLLHQIPSATPVGTFFSPGLWLFRIAPAADLEASAEPPTFDLLQD